MSYEVIADIYDEIMSHVDYTRWAKFINKVQKKFLSEHSGRILDISSGTGNLALELNEFDYEVFLADLSLNMLKIAKDKTEPSLSVVQADMKSLPFIANAWDLIICTYDSFNYLMNVADIEQALREIYNILAPNGIYLFDVTTERNSLKYFNNKVSSEIIGDYRYIRRSIYEKENQIQRNDFTFIDIPNHNQNIQFENHSQRIYPKNLLIDLCQQNKFEILGCWGGFNLKTATELDCRLHFACRKVIS